MRDSTLDELLAMVKGQDNLERLAILTKEAFDKQRAVNAELLAYLEKQHQFLYDPNGANALGNALREALK